MFLTNDQIETNFRLWCEKLNQYGCYSVSLVNEYGDVLKSAPWSRNEERGNCFNGGLLYTVLNTLCTIGYNLNNTRYTPKRLVNANMNSLLKVLLLSHIAKCELFIPNDNMYQVKKGMIYKWNDKLHSVLRTGERSIYMCQKHGISFTEEEYEAMRIIDRDDIENYPFYNGLALMTYLTNKITNAEVESFYRQEKQASNNNILEL